MNISTFLKLALLLIALPILFACGGGGGSTTPSSPPTATGRFIDAPVEGLRYVSGGISGVTGPNGEFTYEVGRPVIFSVGGVKVGQAQGADIITPIELVKTANPGTTVTVATPAVVQIVQFLLTASSSTAAGIRIDQAVAAACTSQDIDLATASAPRFTSMINQIAAAAGNRPVTRATDAQDHFTATMAGLVSGMVVVPPASMTGSGGRTSYRMILQGNFAGREVKALQFDLLTPGGVTLRVDSSNLLVLGSSLALSGAAPNDVFWAGRFAASKLTLGLITATGIAAGEFATMTCDIVSAEGKVPVASEFMVRDLMAFDIQNREIPGVTVVLQ
jgi:hypothetical protein